MRWTEVEALFTRVADLDLEERARILSEVDPELRREVESLLACDGEPLDSAAEAVARGAAAVVSSQSQSWIGRRLGAYRITAVLGEGGMGKVFEAVRDDDQYEKRVAIKVLRLEMDSDFARRRFVEERQILAKLEHPHIARLLDGGSTSEGLPYLVMEFIEGRTIVEYASDRKLPIEERLRLFLTVCQAVAFAHRNLVVHRDLKPSNVLVTADGTARLLDFGIAKLIDSSPAPESRTATAHLMTPEYASPEQVRGEAALAASDIYSLGAILFELLTGRPAHRLVTRSPAEIVAEICEREIAAPSSIATEPALRRKLNGDLDTVVLAATRKDSARRYPSAEGLAEDIRRYLEGLPLVARADSFGYRTGKFIRRNKMAVAAAALVLASLAGGLSAALYQAHLANERFNDVRQLANQFLFDFDDEIVKIPGTVKARAMIATTALHYLDRLSQNAGGDRDLQFEIAQAYEKVAQVEGATTNPSLGRQNDALATMRKALAIYETLAPRGEKYEIALGECLTRLAFLYGGLRQQQPAIDAARRAIEVNRKLSARHPQEKRFVVLIVRATRSLEVNYTMLSNSPAALEALESGLADVKRLEAMDSSRSTRYDAYGYRFSLTRAYASLGRLSDARAEARELEKRIHELRQLAPDEPLYRRSEVNLLQLEASSILDGYKRPGLGQTEEALEAARKQVPLAEANSAADPNDADASVGAGLAYQTLGYEWRDSDPRQALAWVEKARAIYRKLAELDPKSDEYATRVEEGNELRSRILARLGDSAAARAESAAVTLRQRKAFALDGSARRRQNLVWALIAQAEVARLTRSVADAALLSEEAVSLASPLPRAAARDRLVVSEAFRSAGLAHPGEAARQWFEQDAALWREASGNEFARLRLRQAEAALR